MRPTPTDLQPWALSELTRRGEGPAPSTEVAFAPLTGDASARRYYRLECGQAGYIVVDAPPATEKNREFLGVQQLLAAGNVRVPAVLASDLECGYWLLEDLGDRQLLAELNEDSVASRYGQAFQMLRQFGRLLPDDPTWPKYDHALFSEELSRFPEWFVGQMLGLASPPPSWQHLEAILIESALEQPRVLVHRDFHSRNLMILPSEALALIDFQDAVVGPACYDLVSLLRDCYVRWPADKVEAWALEYLAQAQQAGELVGVSPPQFLRWFDLMGLQRHIKVLGTFARLYLRDGKTAYLDDLPLVVSYVREMLARYGETPGPISEAAAWFESDVMAAVRQQPWGSAL
ncbi:hypothetical protein A3709_02795 [Halioglobus sp. HI00S01]|uniref:aminoglycoside phosphotransferase family protein n=1 Tax=Halioglobus sp. HI00S01 TaxID=1822214 RepID=UPI0007C310E8|nr:phosphotransferase [Halioglobus sp. HI00S01]KZX58406.1 hypothetical protein A3709_02795 [Halioglobus sp. HI00S01]